MYRYKILNKTYSRKGIIFVVSAPSGAGKTSLCRELIDTFADLRQSVSFATRPKRGSEQDGIDYHFVGTDTFNEMVQQNKFAEWAEVHGNFYGTANATLATVTESGFDLLLDIDCQGAAQLKKNCQRAVFVFILPPSYAELENRLRGRGTDSEAVIVQRLKNAEGEIANASWYDYLVVNDDFKVAREQLSAIITAERCRSSWTTGLLDKITTKGR